MTQVTWTTGCTPPKVDGWRVETKKVRGVYQVEIRRTFERAGQILVIVGKDGYNYGQTDTIKSTRRPPHDRWHKSTRGYNVRFSSNQAIDMTWQDLDELNYIIKQAKDILETLP